MLWFSYHWHTSPAHIPTTCCEVPTLQDTPVVRNGGRRPALGSLETWYQEPSQASPAGQRSQVTLVEMYNIFILHLFFDLNTSSYRDNLCLQIEVRFVSSLQVETNPLGTKTSTSHLSLSIQTVLVWIYKLLFLICFGREKRIYYLEVFLGLVWVKVWSSLCSNQGFCSRGWPWCANIVNQQAPQVIPFF